MGINYHWFTNIFPPTKVGFAMTSLGNHNKKPGRAGLNVQLTYS